MATQTHRVTNQKRAEVAAMSMWGIQQRDIAATLKISIPTLHRYYKRQLREGQAAGRAKIAQTLFHKGVVKGDTGALIFLAKARLGWREDQRVEVVNGSVPFQPDALAGLSQGQIETLYAQLVAADGDVSAAEAASGVPGLLTLEDGLAEGDEYGDDEEGAA